MIRYYLNTFTPLAFNAFGREAHRDRCIPPFVDGSIRREPDLESPYPSISCLCRAGKFAPRLEIGDVIAYVTKPHKYFGRHLHRRLPAVLRVHEIEPSHGAAASWYRTHSHPIPNNCMVDGNPAKLLDESHRIHEDATTLDDAKLGRRWDGQYAVRARKHPVFVICQSLFLDLSENAPIVTNEHLVAAFGRVPGMQNPGKLPRSEFQTFLELVGIGIELPVQ